MVEWYYPVLALWMPPPWYRERFPEEKRFWSVPLLSLAKGIWNDPEIKSSIHFPERFCSYAGSFLATWRIRSGHSGRIANLCCHTVLWSIFRRRSPGTISFRSVGVDFDECAPIYLLLPSGGSWSRCSLFRSTQRDIATPFAYGSSAELLKGWFGVSHHGSANGYPVLVVEEQKYKGVSTSMIICACFRLSG